MQLAFLPVDDVVPSFIELLDLIPADLGLDDFLNYFMSHDDELILKESYGDAPPAKRARQITKDRRLSHLVEVYDDSPYTMIRTSSHTAIESSCNML